MNRIWLALTSIAAILAISAIAATTATAASFSAEGAALNTPVTIEPEVHILAGHNPILKAGTAVEVECTSITIRGGLAFAGTNKAKVQALAFNGCKAITEPTKCAVQTLIETKPLEVLLENGKKTHFTVEKFSPATGAGTEFTSFKVGNIGTQTCEKTPTAKPKVVGTAKTEEENNTTQTTRHKISVDVLESANELFYAEKSAEITGLGEILVTGTKPFSLLA